MMPGRAGHDGMECHPERSEGSLAKESSKRSFADAQDDRKNIQNDRKNIRDDK